MNIFIDLDKVQNYITQYEMMTKNMDYIKQELYLSKEEISDSTWSGEGREAFDVAFETWLQYMEEVKGYLDTIHSLLIEFGQRESEYLKKQGEDFVKEFDCL